AVPDFGTGIDDPKRVATDTRRKSGLIARYSGSFLIGRQHRAQATGLGVAPARGIEPGCGLVSLGTGRRIDRRRHHRARFRSTVSLETTACLACVRYQYPYLEIIAARMLSREGVAAIWQLHLNAA